MARLSRQAISEALHASFGQVTAAAERLGCNRQHLHRRIQGDQKLQAALCQAREKLVDLAESELVKKIKKGNLTAIIFTLKCLGKARGYVERTEMAVKHSGGAELRVAGLDPAEVRLKAEQLLQWNARHKPNGSPAD